jgi:putative endopeptidase
MLLYRTVAPVVILASAVFLSAAALPVSENVYTQDMDRSIKPGDDFYRYSNGGWLARVTIPPGQSTFDTRAILTERTSQRVRDLIQNAAAAQSVKGSAAQKVGDYYASFVDEGAIDAKGLAPLTGEMSVISAIRDKASLSAYLGSTLNT